MHIGPFITHERLLEIVAGHPRGEHNRVASHHVEAVVRSLAPRGSVNHRPLERPGGLGARTPIAGEHRSNNGDASGRILVEEVAAMVEATAGGDMHRVDGLGEALHAAEERK